MPISQTPYERATSGQPLRPGDKAFLAGRFQHDVHQMMLDAFLESGLRQVDLSKRSGFSPEVVSRLLANAGNPQADTIAIMMGAMGQTIHLSHGPIEEVPRRIRNNVPPLQRKVQQVASGVVTAKEARQTSEIALSVSTFSETKTVVRVKATVG